ncbi:hypothetical protein ACIGMX_34545 [Streptomyces aquilus]|uniref:hypothetical protein n=1 Tax=Streptomyces aquilus TaxID=2548456 RepID=UPI0037D7A9A7
MNRYESEAVVVIDGEETDVYAEFVIDDSATLKTWYGTLTSEEPGFGFKIVTSNRAVLRMPSGKEAPIAPRTNSGGADVPFTGSGAPPV